MVSFIISYFTNSFHWKFVFTTNQNKLNKQFIIIIIFLVVPALSIDCQILDNEHFIQVDGLVLDKKGRPLSNVNIISFSLARGTISEKTGVYSIISTPGDTIVFSAIGFKKAFMKVPVESIYDRLTVDVMLEDDTIKIDDVVILPWKTYDEFKKAVVNYEVNSIETQNMNYNIEMIRKSLNSSTTQASPEAGYRYAMQQNFNSLMTKNQYPVNNLLNPFAWAKFFKGVKNGLLRNEPGTNTKSTKAKVKKIKPVKN
jgi:hypothetical protein